MDVDLTTIEEGARLFKYEERGWSLKPQQILLGETLDQQKPETAILMARRSAKTESVLLWTFAMMERHAGLQVAFTMATTRDAASKKFRGDVYPILHPLTEYRDDVRLLRGNGYESAELNGSLFSVVAPTDQAFRSKKFDIIIMDEGGEADPGTVDDLMPAMLPTLDTSDIGMFIVMGTAGEYRAGNLLWDMLADPEVAAVNFSAGDDIDVAQLANWDYAEAMLDLYHPGIGTLTTAAKVKKSWKNLTPDKFAREYLGVWGDKGNSAGVFSAEQWAALWLPGDLPNPPRRFALAASATEQSASIVAAWREDGEARLLVLDRRSGRAWLPTTACDLARRYRVPIVVDPRANGTVMADVTQRLEQLRPAPVVERQTYEDVAAAHERMVEEVQLGRVRHFGQEPLSIAVLAARKIKMGGQWKFGRITDDVDITALQAATLALRFYDSQARSPMRAVESVAV
jgi:hypothetical protein